MKRVIASHYWHHSQELSAQEQQSVGEGEKKLFCINVAKIVSSLLLTISVIPFNNHRRLCDRECTPKVLKCALMTMLGLKELTGAHLRRYNTNSSHNTFLGIARPAEHLWIVSESSRQWRWRRDEGTEGQRDEGRAGRSGGEGKACGLGSGSHPTNQGGVSPIPQGAVWLQLYCSKSSNV